MDETVIEQIVQARRAANIKAAERNRHRRKKVIRTGKPGRPKVINPGPQPYLIEMESKFDRISGHWLPMVLLQQWCMTMGIKSRREYREAREHFGVQRWAPFCPDRAYRENWPGWAEFLGTDNIPHWVARKDPVQYRDYWSAVRFARTLGFKTVREWREYSNSPEMPIDIPTRPELVYRENWRGFKEFLGFGLSVVATTFEKKEFWVIYDDGRPGIFWWVKLDIDQLATIRTYEGVRIQRIYLFEKALGDEVHTILDAHSSVFEDDVRERTTVNEHALFFDLDCKLIRTT